MIDQLKEKEQEQNLHDGHRERFRNEIRKTGIHTGMPGHKVLEYILFHCLPRGDTNEIAHRLINKFGSFDAVLEASETELKTVDGINDASALFITLLVPIFRYYASKKAEIGTTVSDRDEIGDYILKQYLGHKSEVVSLLSINAKGKILSYDIISEGDINSADASPRKVLEIALRTGAVAMVLAHNHPSGVALPSENDILATIEIKQFLQTINVKLIDHMIVADNDYVSLGQSEKFKDIFK